MLAVEVLETRKRGDRNAEEVALGGTDHRCPEALCIGAKSGEICRRLGISQATFYLWKRQQAGLGVQELHELRQLREENSRLKRTLRWIGRSCRRWYQKSSKAPPAQPVGEVDPGNVQAIRHLGMASGKDGRFPADWANLQGCCRAARKAS